MKRFFFILPLVVLSLFFYLFDERPTEQHSNKTQTKTETKLFSEQLSAEYNIDAHLSTKEKKLNVKEVIIWRNKSDTSTSELQFHLYANAFSSNKTELGKVFDFDKAERTKIHIKSLLADGSEYDLEYFQPEVKNPYDSTAAKINLTKPVYSGDSIEIKIEYELPVPKSRIRFGYAAGREFYFIAQWFPKLGVFKNGRWVCSQYHPNAEFYSDFANYDVSITVPQNYIVGATGKLISAGESDSVKTINYKAEKVIDFAWSASPEFEVAERIYKSTNGREVNVKFLLQLENKDLIERKFVAAFSTIEYLEKFIGEFPYSNITLVDVPRTSNLGGMEYPGIITYFTPLFTPVKLQKPESTIIHELIHQYFYASVSSNEVYEGWLDEGITTYLENKILSEYYGNPILNFKFIDYYPIYGLRFLSFKEIPLLYSLRELETEHYAYNLNQYYLNNDLGGVRDSTYQFPSFLSTVTNVYSKPCLIFNTLENYIGENEILNIISAYYNENKYSIVNSENLLSTLKSYENEDLTWFIDNFINSTNKFDYRVSSVEKTDEQTYKIFVERLEEGITPTQIAIYTITDTSYINWEGKERWREFTIKSREPVIAASVDPHRKNLLDRNFANNSYTVEPKYWAAWSISIRWFFWIQNALMIFGSIG